jgi:hypothetical protein
MSQHFINFAKNDTLGQISIWLIAHADKSGADCDKCDQLAQLHSKAVDFPKTGVPANLERDLVRTGTYFKVDTTCHQKCMLIEGASHWLTVCNPEQCMH